MMSPHTPVRTMIARGFSNNVEATLMVRMMSYHHPQLLLEMMDVFEALSLLKQTYLNLKRNVDVTTALSVLLRFSIPLLRMSEDKEPEA